ncbi:pyrroline-5-carboxylate reductase [Litorivicinus sp.]|mgnify:CR=1 FL=1|jgi:pyrroline-5-carboxylate reductase|nr:pyrroline-5-carboxylate reductase [Litorivicinus sp.]MDC1208935.1 pyrroline-5-carboxylate reductase [Litorivicinus sp.]MDC1240428.1 pyrroline-5-carboxylate reductase [Litorivicinus sp.]|tara:strand:- start:14407 stop:15222 length:816 start_codon:yes stop_codon:yes gene_type:complete
MNNHIGFIGGGNMAQAIIAGLLNNSREGIKISAADPSSTCREALIKKGVSAYAENDPVMANADLIVLAVKPQVLTALLATLRPLVRPKHVFVSIAAGTSLATLRHGLGDTPQPIVRVMPNTPALIGLGMAVMVSDRPMENSIQTEVTELFEACGRTLWISSEETIDAVTAVSGSGPAYFFLMIESMVATAIKLGLSVEDARLLVAQTAKGAAAMVEESDVGPDVLRQRVTSPGGTTEAALEIFESAGFAGLIDRALIAARERAVQLSKELC